MVVISGPDATAGSILIFLKNSGISVPTAPEITIATIRDRPIQPDTASSGYCIFQRVAFDLKKLAELDPEGTKRFMERNGIQQGDVPKQKTKKKQKSQRER